MLCQMGGFPFLRLSDSILHVSHIFFIHAPIDGHLDCFQVLVIVNNATVDIEVEISI